MRISIITAGLLLALAAMPAAAQQASGTGERTTASASQRSVPSAMARTISDGPADVLNGFVLKEIAQCRPLSSTERRSCCERLLHPNACGE
jgi:hypothetical protein